MICATSAALMTATMNSRARLACLTVMLSVQFFAGSAKAAINHYARVSTYHISFADTLTFSDAIASYDAIYVERNDAVGDTYSSSFAVRSGFYNYFHHSSPELTITSDVFNGTSAYSYSLLANAAGIGTHTFHYDTPLASSFSASWIVGGTGNGHYTLEFSGGGFLANILENNSFDIGLSIAGDWSQMGNSTGKLEFLSIDPAWTIVKNFEYDSENGATVFFATNSNYAQFGGPNLNFRLYGATVPEPSAIWLLGIGATCAGMAFARSIRAHRKSFGSVRQVAHI